MPVSERSVQVGKCYVTTTMQVRKVIERNGASLKYVSRGRTDQGGFSSAHVTVGVGSFVRDVDREVTCDWDPNYPERQV